MIGDKWKNLRLKHVWDAQQIKSKLTVLTTVIHIIKKTLKLTKSHQIFKMIFFPKSIYFNNFCRTKLNSTIIRY